MVRHYKWENVAERRPHRHAGSPYGHREAPFKPNGRPRIIAPAIRTGRRSGIEDHAKGGRRTLAQRKAIEIERSVVDTSAAQRDKGSAKLACFLSGQGRYVLSAAMLKCREKDTAVDPAACQLDEEVVAVPTAVVPFFTVHSFVRLSDARYMECGHGSSLDPVPATAPLTGRVQA